MKTETALSLLINGQLHATARTLTVVDPATGQAFAQAPDCSTEQLDLAIQSARHAFPAWRLMGIQNRRLLLQQAASRLSQHTDSLARLLSQEQGKPLKDALAEVSGTVQWLGAQTQMELPELVNEDTQDRRSITRRVPLGVVAALAPWNFPVLLAWWKVFPALLAGNTVVLKPSPMTPLTVLKMGELLADLFPAGVLNVISGGDALGPLLTAHPGIDKISFTGSTQTGRAVMRGAADRLQRLTLELGGNDPAIVLPDVDPQAIAPKLFWAAFYNSGQICIATKRLYIHSSIYEPVAQALADYARTVKLGPGLEADSQLGPIQNRRQYERVLQLIEECKSQGLKLLFQGTAPAQGFFVPITLVDNPPEEARVVSEEAFGPVLPLLRYDSIDEAIERANHSPYGLGATVWGQDTEQAMQVAQRLEAGTVWVNEAQYLNPFAAFAGHKASGLGVEHGLEGFLSYTAPQTLVLKKS